MLLHSGQEMRTEHDLTIRGRDHALPLRISRRHLTRRDSNYEFEGHIDPGFFGPAWSTNLRQVIHSRRDGSLDLFLRGFGSNDVYEFNAGDSDAFRSIWDGGTGRFDRAIWIHGTTELTVRRHDGSKLVFLVENIDGTVLPPSTPGAADSNQLGGIIGILVRRVSADLNTIVYEYEDRANVAAIWDRHLVSIRDSYARELVVTYHPSSDLIHTIVDFVGTGTAAGRELEYTYTGDFLDKVEYPEVTSTQLGMDPGGSLSNDFSGASRRACVYTYLQHSDPRLTYALQSITFPNEVNASGPARLSWTYETTDPVKFGFVLTHTVGAGTTGGTYNYKYTFITPPQAGLKVNNPLMQVTVTDRRNVDFVLEYNQTGQVLSESVPNSLRSELIGGYSRTWKYNTKDGLVKSRIDGEGNRVEFSYDQPMAGQNPILPRVGDRLVNAIKHYPDAARHADQPILIEYVVMEPMFGRVFKHTSPRAEHESGDFTTTYIADYMEDLDAAKAFFALELGMDANALWTAFSDLGIVDQPDDSDGDSSFFQMCRNTVRIEYPDVTLPAVASPSGTQVAYEAFRYNEFGQRVFHRDAEENETTWEYFGEANVDGHGGDDAVPGETRNIPPSTTEGGFLKKMTVDVAAGSSRNSGTGYPPLSLATTYNYAGNSSVDFPANSTGVPTSMTNPRGIETQYMVNEDDRVRVEVTAASAPMGLTAYQYRRRMLYDANGNIVRSDVENRTPLDVNVSGHFTTSYVYDILDNRKYVVEPEVGTPPNTTTPTAKYDYDPENNLIKKTRGFGSTEDAVEKWTYCERNIVMTHTREDGSMTPPVWSYEADANGNRVKWTDATADVELYEYDAYDRLRVVTDRENNTITYTLDADGNATKELQAGDIPGYTTNKVRLAETDFHFDERGRRYCGDAYLFDYASINSGLALPAFDDGALSPVGDDKVSSVTEFDRKGRVVKEYDSDGDVTEFKFDGGDRRRVVEDPVGNLQTYDYDDNSNVIALIETDVSTIPTEPSETYSSFYTNDALDRQETATDPRLVGVSSSQTTTFAYDSRHNLVRRIDELGNSVEWSYDAISRETEERRYLALSGENATSQSNNGIIALGKSWDDLHRLKTQTDSLGNVTTYGWDDLDRQTSVTYEDATSRSWTYTGDDEIDTYTDQRGVIATYTRDARGVVERIDYDTDLDNNGTADLYGTTEQTFDHDGLGRLWGTFDDNTNITFGGGDNVVIRYVLDSLGRVAQETQEAGVHPVQVIKKEYQGRDRVKALVYGDGRRVERFYDELDRTFEVKESGGALIARADYIGRDRIQLLKYGNDVTLDKRTGGYDGYRRSAIHEWRDSSGTLLAGFNREYNGPSGVGTNMAIAEERPHLNHRDEWDLDSVYRIRQYERNQSISPPAPGEMSLMTINGTDKLTAYTVGGVNQAPDFGSDPAEADMNQYSGFGGGLRQYDEAGNLLTIGTGRTYHWDAQGRVSAVTLGASLVGQYAYDALGRRICALAPSVSAQVRTFQYCGDWRIVQEANGLGVLQRQFVDGDEIDDHYQVVELTATSGGTYYYHNNAMQSVGAIVDSASPPTVVSLVEYSWLGRPYLIAAGGPAINSFGMHGGFYDIETSLYHARTRPYDSLTGEYLRLDTLGVWEHEQGNGYSANALNSHRYIDPFGTEVRVRSGRGAFGFHKMICVDEWDECCERIIGEKCFGFYPGENNNGGLTGAGVVKTGQEEFGSKGDWVYAYIQTTCAEDKAALASLRSVRRQGWGRYGLGNRNCRHFCKDQINRLSRLTGKPVRRNKGDGTRRAHARRVDAILAAAAGR